MIDNDSPFFRPGGWNYQELILVILAVAFVYCACRASGLF